MIFYRAPARDAPTSFVVILMLQMDNRGLKIFSPYKMLTLVTGYRSLVTEKNWLQVTDHLSLKKTNSQLPTPNSQLLGPRPKCINRFIFIIFAREGTIWVP